jgi:outer membrane protein
MHMQPKIHLLAAATAALLASPAAMAQDWSIGVGVTRYDTTSKTTGIKGIGIPPGADAVTGDSTTLIVTIERKLMPNVGIELVLGLPPRTKARAAGSVAFLGDDVLSAKNLAPTVIVNYRFGDEGQTWRPYLGLGINYTRFVSIRSSLAPSVAMSDSLGLVAQAGITYAFSKQWGAFASIARVDVKTDLVATASTVLTTNIDFRPVTYSAGIHYKF